MPKTLSFQAKSKLLNAGKQIFSRASDAIVLTEPWIADDDEYILQHPQLIDSKFRKNVKSLSGPVKKGIE